MGLTKQQAFNRALNGVFIQGGPSVINGLCAYRTESGRACGIGYLMSDVFVKTKSEIYDADHMFLKFNTTPVCDLREGNYLPVNVTRFSEVFLTDLQFAHDNAYEKCSDDDFMICFLDNMKVVAKKHGLSKKRVKLLKRKLKTQAKK